MTKSSLLNHQVECVENYAFFSIYGEGVWFPLPKKMQSDNIAGQYRKIIYFLFFHLTKDSMIYWKTEILENRWFASLWVKYNIYVSLHSP